MIQDKIFFDEKDPTGVSYNTPFTVYGSYQGRLWSKTPSGTIKYYTQNSDLSVYATTGSNQFSGSQTITGSLTVTGGITGSVTTASYVEYAGVVNKPALVSSSAQIVGYNVFATTGSNQFNGNQVITGSLTVTGQVVAQTLNVQQVTSSIVYSSGSNIFGNSLGNTQQFTGSVSVTGSLTVTTTGTELQVTSTGVNIGNISTDNHNVTGSLRVSGSMVVTGSGTFTSSVTAASLALSGTVASGGDAATLTIKQAGTTFTNGIYLERAGERNGYYMYIGGALDALTFRRNYFGTQSDVISLTRDGNVGIGTASPGNFSGLTFTGPFLDVAGLMQIKGTSANTIAGLQFGGDTFRKALIYSSVGTADPYFAIGVGTTGSDSSATECMRINSSGSATFSSTVSGISLRSSGVGTFGFNTANNGEFQIYATAFGGIIIAGRGSTYDMVITNKIGSDTIRIPTGTTNVNFVGNVLIGTTTDAASNQPLQVVKAGSSNYLRIQTDNDASYDCAHFFTDGTNSVYAGMMRATSGLTGAFSIFTGGAVRVNVTSAGKVIVGASAFSYPVSIEAQSGGGQLALTRSGAYTEIYMGGTTSGTTQLYVRSGGSGGVRLDAGSTGWVADSDIRLKDIEKPIENAVQSLSTLQTIYYSWKNSENKSIHLGLIAQEVEAVFPEIVSESSISNMKGVNYMELIPVLIKAIQELKSENDTLKSILQRNNIS